MILQDILLYILSSSSLIVTFCFLPTAYKLFQITCVLFIGMWTSYLIYDFVKTFFIKKVSPRNKAVFITGCDSGFGYELAKRLDSLSYQVFAGCLDSKGTGALKLTECCSSNLSIIPIDVTSDESVEEAKQFITKQLDGNVLWAVINNAGISHGGEIDWTSLEELQKVWDVNTFGTVRVTKAFLSLLRASKGRLINNTSACGRFICPGFVGYCMSKGAAIAFSEGLRIEMAKWKVKVITIEPFFYKTPMTTPESAIELIDRSWSKADPKIRAEYGEHYLDSFKMESDKLLHISSSKISQVIDCFEDAVTAEEPRSSYFPSYLPHKIAILFLRIVPSFVQEHIHRRVAREMVKRATLKSTRLIN